MERLIFHVGSGQMFFTGIGMLTLATLLCGSRKKLIVRIGVLLFIVGLIAAAISATPVPTWSVVVAGVVFLCWLATGAESKYKVPSCFAWLTCLALLAAFEAPYHFIPTVDPALDRTLTVVGDSVTAGTGSNDMTMKWPAQIAEKFAIQVDDRSEPGERTSTALKNLQKNPSDSSVFLIEIGGNDLMGSTKEDKFEHDLDALLHFVCKKDRQVVMLELPLPPFRNRYGAIQRRLAGKHGVILIPKQVFLSVITTENSTIDSIHLTQQGHDRFAAAMWDVLKPAYD